MSCLQRRFICWDLDETLGRFRPEDEVRGTLRGLTPLLEGLGQNGCRHVITTASAAEYADYVLRKSGIRDQFEAIFDCAILCQGESNKRYVPVAKHLGIADEEMIDRMIVVGNHELDIPDDIDLVTVLYRYAVYHDARVLDILFSVLLSSDSWDEGYRRLLQACTDIHRHEYFDGGIISLDGGIKLYVGNLMPNPEMRENERFILVSEIPTRYVAELEPAHYTFDELPLVTSNVQN
ncbi:HAD family hydrolase [Candidatus Micrarchaeota archaeon]|nr:HAD family hydrolase [Candidatus Micrarchaeota archaeon]